MLTIARHALVNISDAIALRALKPMGCDYSKLSAESDPTTIFTDAEVAREWEAAAKVHTDLTRTVDGSPTRGGVNPGDQRAIFSFIRKLKPQRVLEIGTHLGYSTVNICQALKLNALESGAAGTLTTVDILDVNHPTDGPWRRVGAAGSPRDSITKLGYEANVSFVRSDSVEFLKTTTQTFDFIFLDGDHASPKVYQEVQLLQRVMEPGSTLLLHDYFPHGRALWKGSLPNTGPWKAIRRLQSEGARITPRPLGALPWPTKLGSHLTSLALLTRS